MADNNPNDKEEEKIPLTAEDYTIARQRIKQLIKGTKKYGAAFGSDALINALADLSLTFCKKDGQNIDYGWFYTYIASKLVSGASATILENLIVKKFREKNISIQNQLQNEYDNFSITERQNRSSSKIAFDIGKMQDACNMYWSARARLVASGLLTPFILGSTIYSQTANLPIMLTALTTSTSISYVLNKKLNKHKINDKEVIRKISSNLDKKNREMIATSVEREFSDPSKQENANQQEHQKSYLQSIQNFINHLQNFAIIGTIAKSAIIGGVIAATYHNPANMLIASTATLLMHNNIDRFWSAGFSLKEHLSAFANAYRSFKPKITDISFGKEQIPENANVIELDKISFKHRQKDDITQKKDEELFISDKTIHIGPGITFLSGASGAGKSTLLDLLKHSDDVSAGHIRIGTTDKNGNFKGIDYKDLAFTEPTRHMAFDSQKGKLNETTVKDFIMRANPTASPEFVNEIKTLVGITQSNTTSQESGLTDNTTISDKLSGGEISRLKLAQTLIKDSPILILDEVTTGIDTALKENILNYINKIKDKKTIIWVTHMPDEINKLEAYQAIDLIKTDPDKPSTFRIYDTSNPEIKEQYETDFRNRKTSSPSQQSNSELASPPQELDLDEIIMKAEQKADEYEIKALQYQKMAREAREAASRIRESKILKDKTSEKTLQSNITKTNEPLIFTPSENIEH